MKIRVLFTIVAVLSVYGFIHVYIGWHAHLTAQHLFDMDMPWVIGLVTVALAVSYIFERLLRSWLPYTISLVMKLVGAYWMAVMMYLLLLLPIADLAAWMLSSVWSVKPEVYVPALSGAVVAILAVIVARGSWNAWQPIIRTHQITVSKQAGELKSLRIAVASDLHLGAIVGNRHLERLVEHMEQIQPDLILIPGDVLDDDVEPFLRHKMADRLRRLQAPLGVYAVLGNHEYYGRGMSRYLSEMHDIGIKVLLDEAVLVADSFYVIGRKDRTAEGGNHGGRKTAEALTADLDHSRLMIMMDHQPYQLDRAASSGVDMLFCGHTHRGQLWPNHWITGRLFELDWGYTLKDKMHAFVSSGFGSWGPPVRLGSRSEILQIDIRFS